MSNKHAICYILFPVNIQKININSIFQQIPPFSLTKAPLQDVYRPWSLRGQNRQSSPEGDREPSWRIMRIIPARNGG